MWRRNQGGLETHLGIRDEPDPSGFQGCQQDVRKEPVHEQNQTRLQSAKTLTKFPHSRPLDHKSSAEGEDETETESQNENPSDSLGYTSPHQINSRPMLHRPLLTADNLDQLFLPKLVPGKLGSSLDEVPNRRRPEPGQ